MKNQVAEIQVDDETDSTQDKTHIQMLVILNNSFAKSHFDRYSEMDFSFIFFGYNPTKLKLSIIADNKKSNIL